MKGVTGAIFCLIAAILYSSRYLEPSEILYSDIGKLFLCLSVISLLIGIAYLLWEDGEDIKKFLIKLVSLLKKLVS